MIIHYLSASRVKKYLQCPEAYHQSYENKVKGDATHLKFGTLVHRVFERYFQEDEDLIDLYEIEWRNADIADPQFFADGYEIINNFARMNGDKENAVIMGLELPFAIDIENNVIVDTDSADFSDRDQAKAFLKRLEEDDKPYIFGFIDRVEYRMDDDVLRIIDYKTSRIPLTQQEADKDEQLSMYALVASYIFPEYSRVQEELHYVRHGAIVKTSRTVGDLELFKKWLLSIYYKIKNDTTHPATINRFCNWCDAKKNCTEYQGVINGEADPDFKANELTFDELDTQLEKINAHIKVLQGRKSEIETLFKEYLTSSDNSPIQTSDGERFLTPNQRTSYSPSAIVRMFPTEELDKLLSVNKSAVDSIAKGNSDLLSELESTSNKYYISPTLRKKKSKK